MKIIVIFFIIIFTLQSWTKADDIKDFQIEGMSIGDSLLDYYTEEEIKDFTKYVLNFPDLFICNNVLI